MAHPASADGESGRHPSAARVTSSTCVSTLKMNSIGMRIAQVAPLHESVPPKYYGGTERVVSYLTEELQSYAQIWCMGGIEGGGTSC